MLLTRTYTNTYTPIGNNITHGLYNYILVHIFLNHDNALCLNKHNLQNQSHLQCIEAEVVHL